MLGVAPEQHAREPSRRERHHRGREPVEDAVVARGRGHDLLEAGFVDFERRGRARDQRAVGKELHVDLVVADRHLRRQRDRGAVERLREQRDAIGLLPVELVFALDAQEGEAERVVGRGIGDVDARALQQHEIVEAELQPAQRFAVGDGVERPVRQHREIGRRILEHARIGIDPDAEHALLAERHQGLARPGDRDDEVIAAAPLPRRLVLLDAAEQHELVAGEARRHHHPVVGDRGDEPLGAGGRPARDIARRAAHARLERQRMAGIISRSPAAGWKRGHRAAARDRAQSGCRPRAPIARAAAAAARR